VGAGAAALPPDAPGRPALERGPHARRRAQQPWVAEPAVCAGERLHARRLRHPGDPARLPAAPREQILEREEAPAPDAESQQLVGERADALVCPPALQEGVERAEAAERLQLPAGPGIELPDDVGAEAVARADRRGGRAPLREPVEVAAQRLERRAGAGVQQPARGQRSGVGDDAGETAALITPQPSHRPARLAPVALPARHLGGVVGPVGGEARERAVDGVARLRSRGGRGEGARRDGEQQQQREGAAHPCPNPGRPGMVHRPSAA
jgi:hypothetical protein